jgi:3-oxoadipate enol-lactonase
MIKIVPSPHIAVDRQGNGPLVIFLHGIGGNRTNWRDQLPAFAPHYTAVAWDARGYGDSEAPDQPWHFADYSADLLRVIDHFGAAQAHLVGLSMGGRIAADFYGRHPERVASLVIADTSFGGPRPTPEKIREVLDLRQRPLLEGKTPADIAPKVAQALTGPSTTEDARQRILASLSTLRKHPYLHTLEAVVNYHDFPSVETITVPCLVLVGAEDTVAKPEIMRDMAERIPGAEFHVIEKAAHLSNIDQPTVFNERVLNFLRQQVTAGGST